MLVLLLFIYPPLAQFALPVLTTKDVIMTVLVVGLMVTYILMSELYQQMGKMEKRLAEVVQNYSIQDYLKRITDNGNEDE